MDLDGTLVDHSRRVSLRTLQAITALHQKGVAVVLATGRMRCATLPYALQLAIQTPLICYQGAMIVTPDGSRCLQHRTMSPLLAQEAFVALESFGFQVNVYVNDVLYVRTMNASVRSYTELAQVEARIPDCWDGFVASWQHGDASNHPTKLVAIGSPDAVATAESDLREAWCRRVWIHSSQPNFLEVCHRDAGKGQAFEWVSGHLGVPLAETVAVGDGCNDQDMLARAGLAVAMGNAHPALKAIAHHVTAPVTQDGVLMVL
jgi:hypothetical protein